MPPGVADMAAPPQSPHRSIMPQSPLRIKQDGKFYERLLTKESSAANPSFRYYWAEPGSVPFVWESQPGTPKDAVRMAAAGGLPAITPPPSYLLRHGNGKAAVASSRHDNHKSKAAAAAKGSKKRHRLKRIRIGFIAGIFRRLTLAKTWRWAAAPPAKVSSSTRWLFSTVASERDEHSDNHHDEETAAAAVAAPQNKTVPCSFRARPSPCLPRFRGARNRAGGDGWA
ncbi:hypothetical protein ACP70R_036541 [Stipagrostis hirtigluma subsp. patula]